MGVCLFVALWTHLVNSLSSELPLRSVAGLLPGMQVLHAAVGHLNKLGRRQLRGALVCRRPHADQTEQGRHAGAVGQVGEDRAQQRAAGGDDADLNLDQVPYRDTSDGDCVVRRK
jgi:hypothetical protein